MRTAFVAGATGYTGGEAVRLLREHGAEVVAHVRPGSPAGARAKDRFLALGARVDESPWELAAMTEALRRARPDAVLALLGTTRARGRAAAARGASETYETIDYGLTRLLLGAAVACGHRPRFVYLSSVGVRPGVTNPYLAVRARLEAELTASGLPWVIARPSFITGPDREEARPAERLAAGAVDAVAGALGVLGIRAAQRWRSTTATGLAGALVRLAFDPAAAGRVFESEALR
ncbi:MAG: NAD(P)H-binding protein [Anaeromyxobacter sp.]